MQKKIINPKVSVIIPTYNSSLTIEKCLESVFNQDYPDLKIVVVDDASVDDTLKKVSKFKAEIISNSENWGVAYSRNVGAKMADSDIIIFIDSDILVPSNIVSYTVKTLLEQPNILAIGGTYSENSKYSNFISDFKNLDLAYRAILGPKHVKYLGSFFLAINKTTFLKAGGFSTDFSGSSAEDVEFGYRVSNGKNVMLSDINIRVDHLKTYTLFSMLKVDFNRIINMMRIIRNSKGKYKAGEHAPLPYFINILIPGLTLLSLFIMVKLKTWWLSLFLASVFLLNNLRFIYFLISKRGIIFALKSVFVLFIEYIVVEFSLLLSFFICRPKQSRNVIS